MITNLEIIVFYIALSVVVYSIPKIIKAIGEVKQWKVAYDKQKRIEKIMKEFEDSMNNIESHDDIDEYIREAILYD